MKTIYALILVVCVVFFSCKKDKKKTGTKQALIANIFPLGPNNFWIAHYHAPYGGPGGGPGSYEKGIDSFFVSLDTVGLNTISINGNIVDTNWVVYNIIKVKRTRKNFLDPTIYYEPIKNYGIVRVDTTTYRVYTAIPACTCWQPNKPLPNYDYFNELLLFDYDMQTNDTAYINAIGYYYNTTLEVDSFLHNGNIIKRQYFYDVLNPGDTAAHRMQFGSIFNTNYYISEVVENYSFTPNAYRDSLFFFYNLNDSVKIKMDTEIYP